jgi:hypothetical protein
MPVYLLHGFRWPRAGYTGIRVHAITCNLEDCSVEYIQNEASKVAILQSFREQFPEIMQHLEDKRSGKTLEFIEQHDPEDESTDNAVTQTHAFIADRVVMIAAGASSLSSSSSVSKDKESEKTTAARSPLSAPSTPGKPSTSSSATSSHLASHNASALYLNVEEIMSNGPAVTPQAWEALAQLRDKIAEGEKIGWWIVYNGDPERSFDNDEDQVEIGSNEEEQNEGDEEIEEDEDHGTPTPTYSLLNSGFLGQPLPTLIPPEMKRLVIDQDSKENINTAQSPTFKDVGTATSGSLPAQSLPKTEAVSPGRPKSSKSNFTSNFSFPLRRKSSKVNMPLPKGDDIPEPPALKEINKKEGRRYRFFGGKSDKKSA